MRAFFSPVSPDMTVAASNSRPNSPTFLRIKLFLSDNQCRVLRRYLIIRMAAYFIEQLWLTAINAISRPRSKQKS